MAISVTQKTETYASLSPIEQLSQAMEKDMRAVNAMIIERMDSPVALIPQLASYLIAAGGKRIRPLLTLASTALYGGEMVRAHRLATAVEFIHTATLLHDDVVDESLERRGQEAANLIFGNQASVLVGDFLFSRAFQLMTEDGSLDVLRILSNASAIISEGEVMQLTTANNIATTMDEYIKVIEAKTAALFAAACEVGPLIAGAPQEQARLMAEYGRMMGIAFQIADDALDYAADRAQLGKTIGDDFREGKMTAPIILALESATDEEHAFWQRTITNQSQNEKDLSQAQAILNRHNAIERSLDLARTYGTKASAALTQTPQHPLRNILDQLISYTIERKS